MSAAMHHFLLGRAHAPTSRCLSLWSGTRPFVIEGIASYKHWKILVSVGRQHLSVYQRSLYTTTKWSDTDLESSRQTTELLGLRTDDFESGRRRTAGGG